MDISSGAADISFEGKRFSTDKMSMDYKVWDGKTVRLEDVPNPGLGDVWVGAAMPGGGRNLFVYGRLSGGHKAFRSQVVTPGWNRVEDEFATNGNRYHLPSKEDNFRKRFLDLDNPLVVAGVRWITRDDVSKRDKRGGRSVSGEPAAKRSKTDVGDSGVVGMGEGDKGANSVSEPMEVDVKDTACGVVETVQATGGEKASACDTGIRQDREVEGGVRGGVPSVIDPALFDAETSGPGPSEGNIGQNDNVHSRAALEWLKWWKGNEFIRKMPTYNLGVEILSALVKKMQTWPNVSAIPVFNTEWAIPPHPANILADLMMAPRGTVAAVELGKCTGSEHEVENVLLSHTGLGDRPGVHGYKVLNVLVVTGTSDGVLKCKPKFGGDLAAPTTFILPSPSGNKNPFQTDSTMVGAGSISSTHFDYHLAGTLIFLLQGEKLWLHWKGTERNRRAWATRYQRSEEQTIEDYLWAIETLEEMSYTFVSVSAEDMAAGTRKAFFMSPYTLHMVISFSQSFHCAVKLVRQEWLDDVEEGLDWDLQVLGNPTGAGSTIEVSLLEAPSLKAEGDMWAMLAKRVGKSGGEDVADVTRRMVAMKTKVNDAVKEWQARMKEKEKGRGKGKKGKSK